MTEVKTDTIEQVEAEIDELTRRRGEAQAQVRRAEARFAELEERRTVLSPKAFSGDEEAVAELEALEDEADQLARSVRVANNAVPEFSRMIQELEPRLKEEREKIQRTRYEELCEERYALDREAQTIMGKLHDTLEEIEEIHLRQIDHARVFAGPTPAISGAPASELLGYWLEAHLRRWLPGTFSAVHASGLYDSPLHKADAYAREPVDAGSS